MSLHIQLTVRKLMYSGFVKARFTYSSLLAGIPPLSLRSRARNQTNQTFRLGSASHYFFYLRGTVGVISIVTLHAKMAMSDLQRLKKQNMDILFIFDQTKLLGVPL